MRLTAGRVGNAAIMVILAIVTGIVLGVTTGCGAPRPPAVVEPSVSPFRDAPSGVVAITDATVVTMTGAVLPHHTVVVRGDRIVALGPSAGQEVPIAATVIDGSGKWLMPALADMHVHLWNKDDLTLFIAAGVTTVRNMSGEPRHLTWRSEIAAGQWIGPTIVTAGRIIDGDPPVWPGSAVLDSAGDAEQLVATQKAAGFDFLEPYTGLSFEAYQALAAAAKRDGMALEGHVPLAVGLPAALAAGQRSIEHLESWLFAMLPEHVDLTRQRGTPEALRMALSQFDPTRLPGLIAKAVAAGAWICPTLTAGDRIGGLDDLAALRQRTRWLDLMAPATLERWDQDPRVSHYDFHDYGTVRAEGRLDAEIVAALAAAHAPLLVGTDTGDPYVVPGASLHDEIELLVAAGIPRPSVLQAATTDAARFLGAEHAGVVEVGARADLLVVSVDPMVAALPLVPDGVVVRGRWLARDRLEAALADIKRRNAGH
ncbi:MAG TPA: amidohydrolase family protein [Kofleriaceae bacterium]|jgi:imidazolonepropionase-like amidohydrolase|nr:amidohydrolase family protein [Kofleriaceae bacterium]